MSSREVIPKPVITASSSGNLKTTITIPFRVTVAPNLSLERGQYYVFADSIFKGRESLEIREGSTTKSYLFQQVSETSGITPLFQVAFPQGDIESDIVYDIPTIVMIDRSITQYNSGGSSTTITNVNAINKQSVRFFLYNSLTTGSLSLDGHTNDQVKMGAVESIKNRRRLLDWDKMNSLIQFFLEENNMTMKQLLQDVARSEFGVTLYKINQNFNVNLIRTTQQLAALANTAPNRWKENDMNLILSLDPSSTTTNTSNISNNDKDLLTFLKANAEKLEDWKVFVFVSEGSLFKGNRDADSFRKEGVGLHRIIYSSSKFDGENLDANAQARIVAHFQAALSSQRSKFNSTITDADNFKKTFSDKDEIAKIFQLYSGILRKLLK